MSGKRGAYLPPEMQDTTDYRWPLAGLMGGLLFLFIFSHRGGMAIWMIALYFTIYYLLALGITRVRAEVGPPTHEMFSANPRQFILDSLGSRMIPPQSLTVLSLYFAFNRGYRAHPMPHTLEAFKLVEVANIRAKRMAVALMCGVFFRYPCFILGVSGGFLQDRCESVGGKGRL